MMRSIKMVGLAFVAVLALSAVAAASASASDLIKFSKTGTFEGTGGTATLEVSNGKVVTCETSTTKGEITSEDHGTALVLFDKCTTKVSIVTLECQTTGFAKGSIEIPHLLILLGSDENPTVKMNPAVLLQASNEAGEPTSIEFTCGPVLGQEAKILVMGSVIGLVKNIANKEIELSLAKGSKAGEQQDRLFWDLSEEGVENKLTSTATGAEKFENLESNEQTTAKLKGTGGTEIQIEE